MLLDLRTTSRNLDGDVFAELIAISDLGSYRLIKHQQNVGIRHLMDFKPDSQMSRGDSRIMKLNDCLLSTS